MFKELNILRIFLESPSRNYNVREAAKVLKIAPATASNYLKKFAKKGILKYKKERSLDLYKANIDNEYYRDIKVYYNITMIRESGLIDAFNEFYLKPTIIFFGSGANGYDTEESDFDFAIISENTKEFTKKDEFKEYIKREIQIFAVKELKNLKNEYLINNILSGIVLQGEIKWM